MDVAGTAIGIASLGIQVCQGLLSYYDAWKSYHPDISSTYEAIMDLSKTLTILKITLQQQADGERVERVRTCVNGCEDALRQLEEKRHNLQKYIEPEGFRQRMRSGLQRSWYPFRKETLEALKTNVINVQERLKLALQVLQLDIGTESHNMVLRLLNQTTAQTNSIVQITAQNQRLLDVQESDEFRRIIAWLGSPDPTTDHATARQRHESQTGTWLPNSSQYQSWKTGAFSHVWLYGKAGCGKTILCSTAIEDIRNTWEQDTDVCYAFFYFSFSDKHKQSNGDLLRSLVAQLGWREPGFSMLRQAYENTRHSPPGLAELEKILLASMRSWKRVFLLVDALDECPVDDETRQGVLQQIEKLAQGAPNLKILATSRELDKIRKAMQALEFEPVSVATRDVDADIRTYLSNQLSSDSSLHELNSEMRTLIENSLAAKADGMFRWAYCQLQELKNLESYKPKYVKHVLESLPPTLDDMYTRILTRIKEMYHNEAVTLLRWLAYARSPPTLGELVDAAIIDPAKEISIEISERGGLRDALNILSGLVMVEDDPDVNAKSHSVTDILASDALNPGPHQHGTVSRSQTLTSDTRIRLAHFSVKEYLESERILESEAKDFHLESAIGHRTIAQSCLTYLQYYSMNAEKHSRKQDLKVWPLLRYAAESWSYHSALQSSGGTNREVSFLLSDNAKDDWIRIFNPEEHCIIRRELSGVPASGLYYASLLGLAVVVSGLLARGEVVNSRGGAFGIPLQAAAYSGHIEVVGILLNNGATSGADINEECGIFGSALQAASCGGHNEVIQLLLERGAEVNSLNGEYGSALQAASAFGRITTMRLLLDRGAYTNFRRGFARGAVYSASKQGSTEMLQLLLDHGSQAKNDEKDFADALHEASWYGHVEVVRLLLKSGANPNPTTKPQTYGYALQAACVGGHTQVVQVLLDHGANVDAKGGTYICPVYAASSKGYVAILKLLLEKGAKVNTKGGLYGNALAAASNNGHEQVVQLLLANGACINTTRALHYASREGHKAIVQLLLKEGAHVDDRDDYFGSPLQVAAHSGRIDIVQVLLDNDSDVNAQGGEYGNVLQAASHAGHDEIVRLLLNAGAIAGGQADS